MNSNILAIKFRLPRLRGLVHSWSEQLGLKKDYTWMYSRCHSLNCLCKFREPRPWIKQVFSKNSFIEKTIVFSI